MEMNATCYYLVIIAFSAFISVHKFVLQGDSSTDLIKTFGFQITGRLHSLAAELQHVKVDLHL